MRTKQLLMAAMALPMAFAACTNDEIVEMNNVSQLESEKIIGEKLIADGAFITLVDDAESRVSGQVFDKNDKLGMAWFNNPKNNGESILDLQDTKFSGNATNEIYNNHLAQLNDNGVFAINGEIYAGAHFIYYPYKNIGFNSELTVDYAAKGAEYQQVERVTGDDQIKDEIMTNALHVSHKEILKASDSKKSDFTLDIEAAPINVMNAFVVQPTLNNKGEAYTKAQSLLKDIVIKEMSIVAGQKIFASTATVKPSKLAEKKTNKDKSFNSDATEEAVQKSLFEDEALYIDPAKRTNSIKTIVAYENNLAEEKLSDIIAYTFPTSVPSPYLTYVTVNIATNVGSFSYQCSEEKLLRLLNGVESDGTTPAKPNFTEACGGYRRIPMDLDLANLKLGAKADSPTAWNLLMKLYEALEIETIPAITVSNMTFTNDIPMYLPEGKNVTAKGDITFEGNQTIPGALTVTKKITVAEGATLTIGTEDVTAENIVVNGTLNLDAEVTATTITNNGTINVNADLTTEDFTNNADATVNIAKGIEITASTTYANAGTIDIKGTITGEVNNTGEIIVTYNEAQVEHAGAGIVRGVLDATEGTGFIAEDAQVLAIYQMIDFANSKVKCNALELIGFNLTEGDQYQVWGSDPLTFTANKFNGIDVKLVNSTLQANASTFSFDELELNGSTITGNISATKLDASNNSVVNGTIQTTGAITANALTVTGDVQATGNVTLTASAITGNVTGTAAITLTSTEVEGNVTGTGAVALTGTTTVTGDVAADALTIDNSTVTGDLTVNGALIIKNNSIVTATAASSAGITAENSTLVGSFNAGAENVTLTNCTIQYNEVASMIKTTGDLTITSADAAAFNIYNTDINATNVTFAGKKGVVLNCSRVEATNKCNVNTKVTHKKVSGLTNESSIKAADINIAVGASLGAGIIAEEI